MKVVYETVETAIRKAVRCADEQNRRIEKIELEWWEANEISDYLRPKLFIEKGDFKHYGPSDEGKEIGYYMGVRLQVAPKDKSFV